MIVAPIMRMSSTFCKYAATENSSGALERGDWYCNNPLRWLSIFAIIGAKKEIARAFENMHTVYGVAANKLIGNV